MAYEVITLPFGFTGRETPQQMALKVKDNLEQVQFYLNQLQQYENVTGVPLNEIVTANNDSWTAAVTTANNAEAAADAAQLDADTANTLLADIASDLKLTPIEKQSTKLLWDSVVAEKSPLDAQATTFGITTEKTTYDNAYGALNTYITPLLADLTVTSDIVGTTFRTSFSDYYTSKIALLNKVSSVAKTLADNAQTAADAAQGVADQAILDAATAQGSANTAITDAATAQSAANTANGLLADIANDGKLTAVEKQQTKVQWDAIVAEKTPIDAQATAFSITTEKTTYDNAYDALNTYITPLLTDLTVTSDIVGTTFRTKFSDYYTAKINLLNKVASVAKALADAAQSAANTAQSAANAAQGDATAALSTLSDIASDAKITPVEKLEAKQKWDAIVVEGTATTGTIPVQATAFGVSDADFDTDYAALNTYLNTTLGVFTNMTTTTDIVRSAWDTAWKNYYDERTKLLNAIAAKAKTLADAAQTTADAKVETFYQTTAPHAEYINVPNNTTYNNYVGDMWYDSDSAEKKTYRYTKTANGGNFDYTWVYLEIPTSVFDTIDGKRTVFMAEPTVPYYVGDLWITSTSASTGDIKKCITERLTGIYTASEWVMGTKYTDDTTANNAQTAANNAQTSADNANALLTDIANDSKLTAVEKQVTKTQWDSVVAEKTILDSQATLYGVTTEKTAYDSAYTTLDTYITPLLADLTTTSNIVAATFRTNFSNYYTAKVNLLNEIADVTKAIADTVASGTLKYRTAGAPTNSPYISDMDIITNDNATINIKLSWDAYVQGTNQADMLLLFWKKGTAPLGAPTINDASIAFNVNTTGPSYYIFEGVNPSDNYTFGLCAARRTENGTEVGPITSTEGYVGTFSRPSPAYNQAGTQIASGLPRYELGPYANIVENGNFVDTTGWSAAGCTMSVANNESTTTATVQYGGPKQTRTEYAQYKGHKLYFVAEIMADDANSHLLLNDGIGQTVVTPTVFGQYQRLSGIRTISASAITTFIKLQDSRTSGWTPNKMRRVMIIDLTANFGAGNEPDTAWCDANFPDWYDGSLFGQGITIEDGTANLLTANQSCFSTDLTGWTIWNYGSKCTITRETSGGWGSLPFLKVVGYLDGTTDTAWSMITGYISVSQNTAHTFSWYQKTNINLSSISGTTTIPSIEFFDSGYVSLGSTTLTNLGTANETWNRKSFSATSPTGAVYAKVRIGFDNPNISSTDYFAITALQLEAKPYATSWQIGGTARAAEVTAIPTAGVFTKGDWGLDFVFKPSVIPSTTTWLWACYIDANNYYGILSASGRIYLVVVSGGVTVSTSNAGDPVMVAGLTYRISIKGNGSVISHWVGGVKGLAGDKAYTESVGTLPANMYLGSTAFSSGHANGIYDDLCISSIARSDAEMQSRGASVEPLPIDAYTTVKYAFDGDLTTLDWQDITGGTPNYTANVGGVAADSISKTSATLIVADGSTSLNTKRADYVVAAASTSAEDIINQAINALPGTTHDRKGKIVLLDGTFIVDGSIVCPSNVEIEMSTGTTIKVKDSLNSNLNVFVNSDTTNGNSNINIHGGVLEGNKANNSSGIQHGIYLIKTTLSNIKTVAQNFRNHGVYLYTNCANNKVNDNICTGCSNDGIFTDGTTSNNTLNNNICKSNRYGMNISGSGQTATGNVCQANALDGLYVLTANSSISANICRGNTYVGLRLASSLVVGNSVIGNTCQGNGQHGLLAFSSKDNTITGNTCTENSQTTNNTYDNIHITDNSDNNSIQANVCRQGNLTNKPRYGIRINTADCDGNKVTNNDLTVGGATAAFSDAGTSTDTTAGNKVA